MDSIDGGLGIDTVENADFSQADTDLSIDDSDTAKSYRVPGGMSISNVERFTNLSLGSGNDLVAYTLRSDNTIKTGAGNDRINPGLGRDDVDGGEGLDSLTIDYSGIILTDTTEGIRGYGNRDDVGRYSGGFYTSSITENFVSFSNIEIIHVTGTGGDDTFGPAGGTDTIDGGPGIDTVDDADFSKATVALNIDDSDSSKTISIVGGPSITNVERFTSLVLGSGDDLVSYTRRIDNFIRTGGGSDLINAGLGFDIVWGGEGLDVLTVDYSSNTYAGSTPLAGLKSILVSDDTGGFTGSYQAYYGDSYVTYDSGNYYKDYDYVGFSNIEQFHITGTFVADDILTGVGDDTIIAGAGDDTISSGAGDDILVGGLGVDSLQGGTGIDHFVYNSASEGGDVITDFDGAVDSIMVSAAGFGGLLSAGFNILASGHYVENTTGLATSAASVGQFIYQTNINQLLWDGDGSGGLSATPLATFQSPQAWSGSCIQVVA